MRIPIAKEGYPFIMGSALPALFLAFVGAYISAACLLAICGFCVFFFRDPERSVPREGSAILSPADGKVLAIETMGDDRNIGRRAVKISIFMSVFNVHVNRSPLSARLVERRYVPGRFISAFKDKSSHLNERNHLLLETTEGTRIMVTQVAGIIARRIVCRAREGDVLETGARFGLIRFGSRLEVVLPDDVDLAVQRGQKVTAGRTILGHMR